MYHFTISPYQFVYHYTISLNKFSRHLTHHLYQYYILVDNLSNYSDSDESQAESSTPNYAKSVGKYDISLHITPYSLDNSTNNNSSESNVYARSIMFTEFGGCKAAIGDNYCAASTFFVYAFNHGFEVSFIKTLECPNSCMQYTFRCHELTQDIFPEVYAHATKVCV